MTESFKQQLQELVDQAAEEYATAPLGFSGRELVNEKEKIDFKQGCEFLMPMIESLVEMRNQYIEYRVNDPIRSEELKQRINKELLQLLKG